MFGYLNQSPVFLENWMNMAVLVPLARPIIITFEKKGNKSGLELFPLLDLVPAPALDIRYFRADVSFGLWFLFLGHKTYMDIRD